MGTHRPDRGDPRGAHLTRATPGRPRRVLYGRRVGRPLRAGRRRLLDALLPRLRVALPDRPGTLDPATLFAGPPPFPEAPFPPSPGAPALREFWLEVGFGNGEHLAAQAQARPDVGLIGCEPFLNGVGACLQQIAAARLGNVRLHPDDAREVIEALAEASIARVFVLFPDPWPKARHARRRFVSAANLDALARIMADGAELRVASDDPGYVRWALACGTAHPAFEWTAESARDWRVRPADQPETRYEGKARARGAAPAFLAFRRRPRQNT